MATYSCGGKPNKESQNIWQKIHSAAQNAKGKVKEKAVDFAGTRLGVAAIGIVSGAATVGFDKIREFSFALPNSHYFAGAVGSGAAFAEAATAGVTLVAASALVYDASQTKLGKAFIHGTKNTAAKMNDYTKRKIVPFAKKAMSNIQSRFADGMDIYAPSKSGDGVVYAGTAVQTQDGGKIVKQPLKVLNSWFQKVKGR